MDCILLYYRKAKFSLLDPLVLFDLSNCLLPVTYAAVSPLPQECKRAHPG